MIFYFNFINTNIPSDISITKILELPSITNYEENRPEYVNPRILILDINNILFLLELVNNKILTDQFYSIINRSEYRNEEFLAQKPNFPDDVYSKLFELQNEYDNIELKKLERRLLDLPSGFSHYNEYEEIGAALVKNLFSNSLTSFLKKYRTNNNLFEMDLICNIV